MIKSRKMKWTGHVARMRGKRNECWIFVGKPEGRRPLRRPRFRWVDNIKMDLREIGWVGMDCIDLAQDRNEWRALVNKKLNLLAAQNVGNLFCSCRNGGCTRRAQLHGVSYVST
jgi:hypothetical protein